jgi:hypothetical protein
MVKWRRAIEAPSGDTMKTLAAVLCLLLMPVTLLAAPASAASIERFLVLTEAEKNLEAAQHYSERMMQEAMREQNQRRMLSPEVQNRMRDAMQKSAQAMREEMSWATMKPLMVKIYADSFTQEELDGLIAFYESPAGRAFTQKMPVVMERSMALMQDRIGPLMQRMESRMREAMAEK